VTLGGEGFLSSPATFHFPPGLERLLGLRIIAFIFLGSAEGTIISRLGFEWARRFQFGCSVGMKPKHGQSQDPDHGEKTEEDEKKEWVCIYPVIQREWRYGPGKFIFARRYRLPLSPELPTTD